MLNKEKNCVCGVEYYLIMQFKVSLPRNISSSSFTQPQLFAVHIAHVSSSNIHTNHSLTCGSVCSVECIYSVFQYVTSLIFNTKQICLC